MSSQNLLQEISSLDLLTDLSYFKRNKKIFISFKLKNGTKIFLNVPSFMKISLVDKKLIFYFFKHSKKNKIELKNFFNHIKIYLDSSNKNFRKKLILKGAGYSCKLSEKKDKLILTLGFSHLVNVNIPNSLKIFCEKNSIVVEGSDKVSVSDFASKIRCLKIPDAYKGKGF
jgi:large subunit ribosomal protein L6